MSYAIFRSEPIYTLNDLAQIGSHNNREKKAYQSNPDIDINKSINNIDIVPCKMKYTKRFMEITKDYKMEHELRMRTMREDRRKSFSQTLNDSKSVVADELLFTSDSTFFKDLDQTQIQKWANICMEFVYQDLGYTKEQVLHATIHMDEKTPHLHCVVVPILKKFDKRTNSLKWTISKKQYIRDKTHLSELQDKYYERMVNADFNLQRGIKNSDNEHLSIKEFKKITRKLDNNLVKQNQVLNEQYNNLKTKFDSSKTTLSGKDIKINKDTYDHLKNFMNNTKKVIDQVPRNLALCEELTTYVNSYRKLEKEKRNIQYEINSLKKKNNDLQQKNDFLWSLIKTLIEELKKWFHKILKIGSYEDKKEISSCLMQYHEKDILNSSELIEITKNTTEESEIHNYLVDSSFIEEEYASEKDNDSFDFSR